MIADPNFEIGSHGLRHRDMARLSGEALRDEIMLTEAAYVRARDNLLARQCIVPGEPDRALPERIAVMRFPYGSCNAGRWRRWRNMANSPFNGTSSPAIRIRTSRPRQSPDDPDQGASGRNHSGARQWPRPHTGRGAGLALQAEGRRLQLCHGERAAGRPATPVIAQSCYLDQPGAVPHLARVNRPQGSHDLFSIFDRPN